MVLETRQIAQPWNNKVKGVVTSQLIINAHAIAHTRTRVASTASHIGKANDFHLSNGRESISRFHACILDAAGLRRPQCPTEVRSKTYV